MQTMSLRVDETLKKQAEQISGELGISLSAAVNIFLKKFVTEGGFPFALKVEPKPTGNIDLSAFPTDAAVAAARSAVAASASEQSLPETTYFDSETNRFIKI